MIKLERKPECATKLFNAVLDHIQFYRGSIAGIKNIKQDLKANPDIAEAQLKLLITATPKKLREIVDNEALYPEYSKWDLSKLYSLFSSRGDKIGRKNHSYTAIELVEDLGITVCPYCNRQYINNTIDLKGKRRSCQLDHFYPKSDYEHLALSFFNLIPVCSHCNHIKLDNKLGKSPYEIEETDDYIQFGFTPTASDFLGNHDSINITIEEKNIGKDSYVDVLALEKHYQTHRDYVGDLLKRKQLYDDTFLENDLRKTFEGLFKDRDLKRIVWGNYTDKEDLHKRPLSKLTRDILKKIEPGIMDDETP